MPDEVQIKEPASETDSPTTRQSTPAKKQSVKRGVKKKSQKKRRAKGTSKATAQNIQAKYPRYAVEKSLRIPRAILEQNAGKECSDREAAGFLGLVLTGPIQVEINSALKYGFLERPSPGRLALTALGRKVLRPQGSKDIIEGYRAAVLNAPEISDVYKHYRATSLLFGQKLYVGQRLSAGLCLKTPTCPISA